jgi:hypothetical protein
VLVLAAASRSGFVTDSIREEAYSSRPRLD